MLRIQSGWNKLSLMYYFLQDATLQQIFNSVPRYVVLRTCFYAQSAKVRRSM